MIYRRTQHALNRWVQCGLSSIFLALGFFNSQTKSTLAHLSVMQTVGQQANLIHDPQEIRQLTAFFAWASVADRPGQDYSYTSNFPFGPLVGNKASTDAVLWSALSLIALLGGTAAVLFAFGRFNFLGWMGKKEHVHPQMLPCGETTASQRGTIKFFLTVDLLLLAQGIAGALISHCRVDPSSFYGLDLSRFLPSNITRTWHLQTALF